MKRKEAELINEKSAPSQPAAVTTPAKAKAGRTNGIDRALQILDCLQSLDKPLTAYEIGHAIGAPQSTVYSIIDHLIECELLSRDNSGAVWLGSRLYYYGIAYEKHLDLLTEARKGMAELSMLSGESVQICQRDGDFMVVTAMQHGPDHFNVASSEGSRTPLNWSASGRLLVGHLDRNALVELFARIAEESPTGRAKVDPQELADEARAALTAGICIQAGESDFAVSCVAAPIIDLNGACQATISLVVPESKLEKQKVEFVDMVKSCAERVRRRVGWLGEPNFSGA